MLLIHNYAIIPRFSAPPFSSATLASIYSN
jgi:hypothetical protein